LNAEQPRILRVFHGGFGGLRVGDVVLPPEQTGAPSSADYGAENVCKRDRVYITTSELAAKMWAALHPSGRGKVYEVTPLGPTKPDPDCTLEGLSFETTSARVDRVIQMSRGERERIRAAVLEV
jgi:rifampin ADP-ribosylating transferase